jgi:phosphoribosyl 1,2-cyclic phosphate phosphodiesterase
LKLVFLGSGTSQGVPVIGCECEVCRSVDFRDKRLRVSVIFQVNGLHILVDTGPDFRQQMLRERVDKIDAVLYTHQHKDHTAGLDDIRPFNHKYKMDMPLYGKQEVLDQLKREFAYIFENTTYPGIPRVLVHPIENKAFAIQDISILPIEVMHHKLPVFGFRIGDIAYITDANYISEEEKKKLKNCKVLVINALHKKPHISHFTLQEAIEIAKELQAEKTYFTHISHTMGLHAEVSKELPVGMELAYDGLTVEVD